MKTFIHEFKLIGLSKPLSMSCTTMDEKYVFWPKVTMSKERFDALYDYCKGNWKDKKIVEIECEGLHKDGTPINPVVVTVKES